MSGFQQIRLYQSITSSIPVGVFTDITNQIISSANSSTVVPNVSYDYDGCEVTANDLTPGETYYFWVELIDSSGNSSGVRSLGNITTASLYC